MTESYKFENTFLPGGGGGLLVWDTAQLATGTVSSFVSVKLGDLSLWTLVRPAGTVGAVACPNSGRDGNCLIPLAAAGEFPARPVTGEVDRAEQLPGGSITRITTSPASTADLTIPFHAPHSAQPTA